MRRRRRRRLKMNMLLQHRARIKQPLTLKWHFVSFQMPECIPKYLFFKRQTSRAEEWYTTTREHGGAMCLPPLSRQIGSESFGWRPRQQQQQQQLRWKRAVNSELPPQLKNNEWQVLNGGGFYFFICFIQSFAAFILRWRFVIILQSSRLFLLSSSARPKSVVQIHFDDWRAVLLVFWHNYFRLMTLWLAPDQS